MVELIPVECLSKFMTSRRAFPLAFLFLFFIFFGLRVIGGSQWLGLTYDSVFYASAADRAASGIVDGTIGAIWLPLISWCAAPFTLLGASSVQAILLVNGIAIGILLLIFYWGLEQEYGQVNAGLATLLLATDSLVIEQASTISSDALFCSLAFILLLRVLKNPLPSVIDGIILALLVLCRIPGWTLCLLVIGLWVLNVFRKKALIKDLILSLLPLGFVSLFLCCYFLKKTGLFLPSATFALNRFYLHVDWLNLDPDGWCRLYDGHHTVLGDLQPLREAVSLPPASITPFRIEAPYKLGVLRQYLAAWGQLVSLPVLIVAAAGALSMGRKAIPLALACLFETFGIVGAKFLWRYFLPALPIYYWFFAQGLHHPVLYRKRWLFFLFGLGINVFISAQQIPWGNILFHRFPLSAGGELFNRVGPGHTIATVQNLQSAVESRGNWRFLPCAPAGDLTRYFSEQGVEYLILPSRAANQNRALNQLLSTKRIFLEFEWNGERVYRVLLISSLDNQH